MVKMGCVSSQLGVLELYPALPSLGQGKHFLNL